MRLEYWALERWGRGTSNEKRPKRELKRTTKHERVKGKGKGCVREGEGEGGGLATSKAAPAQEKWGKNVGKDAGKGKDQVKYAPKVY